MLDKVPPIDSKANFAIDRWNLEFVDASVEARFQAHKSAQTRASLTVTLIFCSVFYLAFSLTDIGALGYTKTALILLLARCLVAVSATAAVWAVRLNADSEKIRTAAATAVEIIGFAVFMLIAWDRPGELPWHAMSMCIMLIVVHVFIPNRLVFALCVAVAATVGFIALAFVLRTRSPSDMLTMSMLLLFANGVGYVSARRFARLARDEFRQNTLLLNMSIRDSLTGCFNRRYLTDNLFAAELRRARRYRLPFSVVLCDIDHFKVINDTYGHPSGDAVLRTFARVLSIHSRDGIDSVVRYGGEEFLLLLPQTDAQGAAALAERLRASFEATPTADWSGREIRSTASFGVVSVDFARDDLAVTEEVLVGAADAQLYRAKDGGRNKVCTDDGTPATLRPFGLEKPAMPARFECGLE